MMTGDSVDELASLLRSIEKTTDWEFDRDNFDDRFRMQKFVFFAKEYGIDTGHSYGIHLHGPYSPELAEDYYSDKFDRVRTIAPSVDDFEAERFDRDIAQQDKDWLEIAATIKSVADRHSTWNAKNTRSEVVKRVCELKEVPRNRVDDIFSELQEMNLL